MSRKPAIENNSQLKSNPFSVPEGYFTGLEERLMRIPEQAPKGKVILFKQTWFRTLAAAATVALLVTLAWLNWNDTTQVTLSGDDIIALTESGYLPYAELTFLEVVDEADLDQLSFNDENLTEYYEYTQPDLVEDYYLTTEDI